MNILVIPSWYPSQDRLINGIMIYEQLRTLCKMYPTINIGVSIWGQQEDRYLLSLKDHIKNLSKIVRPLEQSSVTEILPNLREYKTPAFTWTRQIAKGNLNGIVRANLHNLKSFEADFGPAQIIHTQVAHPAGRIAMEVSAATGIPYCITERMGPFPSIYATDGKGNLSPTSKRVYDGSVANIAVSPFLAKAMASHGIGKIHVIPNFANEHFFMPKENSTNSKFTFFTLGRIESLKGIKELIVAAKLASEKHENVCLRIGGIGQQLEEFQSLAKELGVDNAIEWLGDLSRKQALEEYQNCDAFVLPSYYESFGISFIEALACGKPVIATKCGGPESIVTPANGILIEKESPEAVANAMLSMIKNHSNYNSAQIRQDFLNRFSSQAVVPQMVAFYKELIYNRTAV